MTPPVNLSKQCGPSWMRSIVEYTLMEELLAGSRA